VSYLVIDAAFLACPRANDLPHSERRKIVGSYVSRLADLSRLRTTCRSTGFLRDEQLALTLHEVGSYPFRASLAEALALCTEDFDIQVEDVNRLANFLLERSDLIEELGEFRDVVVAKCSVTPELNLDQAPQLFAQLSRMMALVALHFGRDTENMFLATALSTEVQQKLSFHMSVALAERHDYSIVEPTKPVSITLPLHLDTAQYLRALNLLVLIQHGTTEAIVDSCIAYAVRDGAEPVARSEALAGMMTVGKDFLSSASHLGFLHEPGKIQKLLRACADILLGRNLAKSHHLRSGQGGNNPQRMRGDFGAWRHDLDDEFHLHYWRKGDAFEFANVVVHNEFGITY
jgi:hypothetical protein